jgi:hypothetical protein
VHPVGSPLDLLASPGPASRRDAKKSPSHHGLGRLRTGRAGPIGIAGARALDLTGILVTSTVLIVAIIPLVPIVIEERLFCITSAFEKGMAIIDWLFQWVNGLREGPTTNGKWEAKRSKNDDHAHCAVPACLDFRSFPYRRAPQLQPLADGDLMPVVRCL